jgi:hypothetical protein
VDQAAAFPHVPLALALRVLRMSLPVLLFTVAASELHLEAARSYVKTGGFTTSSSAAVSIFLNKMGGRPWHASHDGGGARMLGAARLQDDWSHAAERYARQHKGRAQRREQLQWKNED